MIGMKSNILDTKDEYICQETGSLAGPEEAITPKGKDTGKGRGNGTELQAQIKAVG